MTEHNWRWAIGEAIERIHGRYQHIGRKTGAPFLALVYPPDQIPALNLLCAKHLREICDQEVARTEVDGAPVIIRAPSARPFDN